MADLSMRVKLSGHHKRPDEVVECTPPGYARLFPGGGKQDGDVPIGLWRQGVAEFREQSHIA